MITMDQCVQWCNGAWACRPPPGVGPRFGLGARAASVVAALLVVALLGGCALPPLDGRSVSTALAPEVRTELGSEVAPMVRAHPGKTGVVGLEGGLEAFATRMHLADVAQRSLDLQYYIWHPDLTGTMLMHAVLRAADRGVRVRLLLDDNNTGGSDDALARLAAHPNVELRLYNPFVGVQRGARWLGYLTDLSRLNHRMHNKSFTVDGWVSVVGGRNIGDEYFSAGEHANFVDLDVMVVGAVVPDISREFDRYWASDSAYPARLVLEPNSATPLPEVDPVQAADYLEALHADTAVRQLQARAFEPEWVEARLIADDPRKTTGTAPPQAPFGERLEQALGRPKRDVYIVSPYFVPAAEGTRLLTDQARAGVDTRVLTNSFSATDVAPVHAGYARYRKRLLEGGVKLYELKPDPVDATEPDTADASSGTGSVKKMVGSGGSLGGSGSGGSDGDHPRRRWGPSVSRASLHAKTTQVDRQRLFVGSFNFDPRSVEINTEMGVVLDSAKLANHMAGRFMRGTEHSYEVRLDEQGALIWVEPPADAQGEPRVYTTEPGTTWWQRLVLRVLGWLPIEGLL